MSVKLKVQSLHDASKSMMNRKFKSDKYFGSLVYKRIPFGPVLVFIVVLFGLVPPCVLSWNHNLYLM